MSRWGISGKPLSLNLPYAADIQRAALAHDFPPCFAYAISWHESICGQVNGSWNACTVVSPDGGHGIFQLTSWVPDGWDTPGVNASYAIQDWLLPDTIRAFREFGFTGDDLVRAVAAAFNGGWTGMVQGHQEGDVGKYTTDHYPDAVLSIYHNLIATGHPNGRA